MWWWDVFFNSYSYTYDHKASSTSPRIRACDTRPSPLVGEFTAPDIVETAPKDDSQQWRLGMRKTAPWWHVHAIHTGRGLLNEQFCFFSVVQAHIRHLSTRFYLFLFIDTEVIPWGKKITNVPLPISKSPMPKPNMYMWTCVPVPCFQGHKDMECDSNRLVLTCTNPCGIRSSWPTHNCTKMVR